MEDKPIFNSASRLLTDEENEEVFKMLGYRCKSRSTAIVQVYGTTPPYHSVWEFWCFGVATFVKDFSRRSFFIQVFDIDENAKVFEQEIYRDFSYCVNPAFFHQFESENAIIGLNFADEIEAQHFGSTVLNYVERKKNKKEIPENEINPTSEKTNVKRSNRKLRSRRITKSQIGFPENFRHIQHVGLDSGLNSPTENLLACIIDMSNPNPTGKENQSMNLISPILSDVKEDRKENSSTQFPTLSSKAKREKFSSSKSTSLKSSFNSTIPSPPIIPHSPKPRIKSQSHNPPPPPPPPPPGSEMKPKAPLTAEKPVMIVKEVTKDFNPEIVQDETSSRDDLLIEIRNPKLKLKHVESKMEDKSKQTPTPESSNFILNSLAKALEDRRPMIRGNSDEDCYGDLSYSDDDSDSDWG